MECSKKVREGKCRYPCDVKLPCGHACNEPCGRPCTKQCKVMGSFKSPCGHGVQIECFRSSDEKFILSKCKVRCNKLLSCGHKCRGNCFIYHQSRLHPKCKEICKKKLLPCGHICSDPCSDTCEPCKERCDKACEHTQCQKLCVEQCNPCRKPCKWQCPHLRCSRPCEDPCNRKICEEPCTKKLSCTHPCLGFCGELCPKICSICDEKKFAKLSSNKGDKARFIKLRNCKHIFEWSMFCDRQKTANKVPRCPKCNTAVNEKFASCFSGRMLEKEVDCNPQKTMMRQKVLVECITILQKEMYSDLIDVLEVVKNSITPKTLDKELARIEEWLKVIEELNSSHQNMCSFHLYLSMTKKHTLVQFKYIDLWNMILEFLKKNCKNSSKQQVNDARCEVQRFQLLVQLFKAGYMAREKEELKQDVDNEIINLCLWLLEPKPLQRDAQNKVDQVIKNLEI